ncbi:MAG TPA: hypothetical protein VH934_16020 [Xanthobacteraceae bacterium]|jgi:hypothetical protein
MRRRLIAPVERETRQPAASKRRAVAVVQLIATAALALSTAVAVTAVSIGIARADVLGVVAEGDATPFAVALSLGLLFSALGVLTAVVAVGPRRD